MITATLRPTGPLSEWPRSDTLFGAICWGIRLSEGEEKLEDILLQFIDDNPPFRISSAYPLLQPDGERVHLLPKPAIPLQTAVQQKSREGTIEALKRWKSLEFVPEHIFRKIVTGKIEKTDLLDAFQGRSNTITIDETRYLKIDEFLLPENILSVDSETGKQKSPQRPFVESERIRNAVNRLSNATEGQLFLDHSIHLADWACLSLAIEGDVKQVLTGLAAIQDHGIGGGKSVGNGTYELGELDELNLPTDSSGPSCTLSLCIPRDDVLETVLKNGFYETETRKGVIESSFTNGSDIWKKQVLALTEGSILPEVTNDIGHNPIVANRFEHGVQQFGYELPVHVSKSALPE